MSRPVARPLVISHRTNMGTSPENSLEGVAAALAEGADGIELDVRASTDGVPMLLHDATLQRTLGNARRLSDLTSTEARTLGVPALAAALALVEGRATLYIEVKEPGLGQAVAREVREAGAAAWCWLWGFDPRAALECRDALPEVPVALNVAPQSPEAHGYGSALEVATSSGFAALSYDHRLVTPRSVEEAHARGLLVFTWTVNEPADIEAVLDAGVDGVCGNYPSRILAALERRGLRQSGD